MILSEREQRAAAVAEALEWENTPFHDRARLKGEGVDCAHIPYAVFRALGLIEEIEIPFYTADYLLHSDRELFLEIVDKFCREVTDREPLPADLLMFKYGRSFSHGALVIEYPRIIHARLSAGRVVRGNLDEDVELQWLTQTRRRPRRLYTLKQWS